MITIELCVGLVIADVEDAVRRPMDIIGGRKFE